MEIESLDDKPQTSLHESVILAEGDNVHLPNTENVEGVEGPIVGEGTASFTYPVYLFDQQCLYVAGASFQENRRKQEFLKGCKWSPDGTCLLTCANDDTLHLFDLPADLYKSNNTTYQGCSSPTINSALKIKEGELIYDYCWHPHMSSWHPETCLYNQ